MLFLQALQGFVSFGTQVVCLEVFHCVSGSVAAAQEDLGMFAVGSQRFRCALVRSDLFIKLRFLSNLRR